MSYKSLLVHLDPGQETSARLKAAAGLARRFGAKLIGAAVADPSRATPIRSAVAPLAHLYQEQCIDCIAALRRTFDAETSGLTTEWRGAIGSPAEFLAQQARAADLIIVGGDAAESVDAPFRLDGADLLMAAGRPLLFLPPGMAQLTADRAVVGWKAGRHARIAVQQALPLLRLASEVTVIGVGEEASQDELEDVAGYLKTHGVEARGQWQGSSGGSPAEALVGAAVLGGADLLVTGGFGRGRMREWVLGGVTRDLLAGSTVACLMAH